VFELFDTEYEVRKTAGQLPHWFQPGVTYFITFRTDDSVPATVADEWYRHRNEWLRAKGVDPSRSDWRCRLEQLPEPDKRAFHLTFPDEFMKYLDRGCGECVLRRPELARIVADSFHHFDGQRYTLGDYVVMPNHVHLLVCLLADTDVERQCYSWKKFTARDINRTLGRVGRFWHEESFDHLVRNPDQLDYLRWYIANNPRKAGLREGEYLHWTRAR
jgi:REP element-mobilizing transposase RayT